MAKCSVQFFEKILNGVGIVARATVGLWPLGTSVALAI
jgi:hypothetical protein